VGRFPNEGHGVLCEPKAVRFRFVEEHRDQFPTERLCHVMKVSARRLWAFRSRPASRRQRGDPGLALAWCHRLGREQTDETGLGDPCVEDGHRVPFAIQRLHSSHGSRSQYCSHDYQKILRLNGFKVSMSGKGNCYEFKDGLRSRSDDPGDHLTSQNAAVETFFKTIKAELIWRHTWETRRQAELSIFEYVNGFHNPRRRRSALGWKSPFAFEQKLA
jgi:putative transposase